MRPALIHVLTGLLLGGALVGLVHLPEQVVAQYEERTPMPPLKGVHPSFPERVIRIAPSVEHQLDRPKSPNAAERRPLAAPEDAALVRRPIPSAPTTAPKLQAAPPPGPLPAQSRPAAPRPAAPAPPSPPAPTPRSDVRAPQPPPPAPTDEEDEKKKKKKKKKEKKEKKEKEKEEDDDDGGDDDDDGGDGGGDQDD